jgi:hypothetical protein
MMTQQPMTGADRYPGRPLSEQPTQLLRLRPPRYQGRRPLRDPANPPTGGWRGLLSVASVVTVALVPGAAMAVGSVAAASGAVCGYGSFCLYSGPDFTGDKVEYDTRQLFCQDSRPGLIVHNVLPKGIRSVYNNTGTTTDGLGVKIYTEQGRIAMPTVAPGREVRTVDAQAAQDMHTLCTYPGITGQPPK